MQKLIVYWRSYIGYNFICFNIKPINTRNIASACNISCVYGFIIIINKNMDESFSDYSYL